MCNDKQLRALGKLIDDIPRWRNVAIWKGVSDLLHLHYQDGTRKAISPLGEIIEVSRPEMDEAWIKVNPKEASWLG